MNWFERYGIVGAYFFVITFIWLICCKLIALDDSYIQLIIWLFASSILPFGYILSIFSQWCYYKLPYTRKFHKEIFNNITEGSSHKKKLKKLGLYKCCEESKTEAIITVYDRTEELIKVDQMELLKPQCTKRFDVIAINNSIILSTILSLIIYSLVACFTLLVPCFTKGISIEIYHLLIPIPFIFSAILILIMLVSSKVLGDQIIEINKILFEKDTLLAEKDKPTE